VEKGGYDEGMGGRKTWFRDCLVQFKKEIVFTVSDIGLTNWKKVHFIG
jgi:hypothetical protein